MYEQYESLVIIRIITTLLHRHKFRLKFDFLRLRRQLICGMVLSNGNLEIDKTWYHLIILKLCMGSHHLTRRFVFAAMQLSF